MKLRPLPNLQRRSAELDAYPNARTLLKKSGLKKSGLKKSGLKKSGTFAPLIQTGNGSGRFTRTGRFFRHVIFE
jgi:hypothetical protein